MEKVLAEGGHGLGIVFISVMGGIERVQDDDLCLGGASGLNKLCQALGGIEQFSKGVGIDQQPLIGGGSDTMAHEKESSGKLLWRKLELADQNASGFGDSKAELGIP